MSEKIEVAKPDYIGLSNITRSFVPFAKEPTSGQLIAIAHALTQAHTDAQALAAATNEIERLRAELAASQLDARRLDWLQAMGGEVPSAEMVALLDKAFESKSGLREAIDAALQSQRTAK